MRRAARSTAADVSSSVTAHECVGATRCGYASECFSERARELARQADVVVTNHAMLSIDAFSGIPLLPEHDVVVIDEAHELVDRATGAVTDELTAAAVERAARRIRRLVARTHRDGVVLSEEHTGDGSLIRARVGLALAAELAPYSLVGPTDDPQPAPVR